MYCPTCGTKNESGARQCVRCTGMLPVSAVRPEAAGDPGKGSTAGPCAADLVPPKPPPGPPAVPPPPPPPSEYAPTASRYVPASVEIPNHLVKAILATLFCCLPIGIVAVVYAAQVSGYSEAGNLPRALECSKRADQWANASLILGLLLGLLYMVTALLGAAG